MMGKERVVLEMLLMSEIHSPWDLRSFAERPMSFTPLWSNDGFNLAKAPNSVVHTGVKSAGCENRMAHLSPIHEWKSISPCVV